MSKKEKEIIFGDLPYKITVELFYNSEIHQKKLRLFLFPKYVIRQYLKLNYQKIIDDLHLKYKNVSNKGKIK